MAKCNCDLEISTAPRKVQAGRWLWWMVFRIGAVRSKSMRRNRDGIRGKVVSFFDE